MDDAELRPLSALTTVEDSKEPPKLQPLDIKVTKRKKSIWKKGVGLIVSEDANTIGGFIVNEVVVPAIKNLLYDSVVGTAGILFNGGTKKPKKSIFSSSNSQYEYRSYDAIYKEKDRPSVKDVSDKYRGKIDVEDLIFGTSGEAKEVLEILCDRAEEYGVASVQDLYDLLNIGSAPSISTKWGWTDLSSAKIKNCREGYLLDLPPVVPIRN